MNKNKVFRYLEYYNQHINEKLYNIIDYYIKIAKDKITIPVNIKKEDANYEYSGIYKK